MRIASYSHASFATMSPSPKIAIAAQTACGDAMPNATSKPARRLPSAWDETAIRSGRAADARQQHHTADCGELRKIARDGSGGFVAKVEAG
ncbi:hypothetical protein [Burkholderia cenocepacia]|uniref:hypothetical protein n=1 Tax=Burkholderia cenocepacia TaxID=95486 RepID=UPI00264F3488|nr:hypothetical protein [Burkholderia cenocepacia]MDN7452504.1 hypothetical protein [Burkholderia cenocepacia]